jgi:hypothetical protein
MGVATIYLGSPTSCHMASRGSSSLDSESYGASSKSTSYPSLRHQPKHTLLVQMSVILSCFVSELQEPTSPGIELRSLFQSFDPPMFSYRSQLKKHAKFGANRLIPSRALGDHTHKYTHNFNFIYKVITTDGWWQDMDIRTYLSFLSVYFGTNLFTSI